MEQDNLEQLSAFLQEEIFLLPEDKQRIKSEWMNAAGELPGTNNPPASPSSPMTPPSPAKSEVAEEVEAIPIQVRGNYTKGILVLHEESDLSDEVMDMLVKMITACGHSMNEIGLLASESLEGRSMEEFKALNAHVVLKFGRIKHPINAVPTQYYEIFTEKETEYLFADALSTIAEDKPLKKKLWTALQQLFNLKS